MSLGDYLGLVALGLLGTGHCVGMCGGFALAVGAGAPGPVRVISRQVAYQFGKATSYLLIGVVLLLTGSAMAGAMRLTAARTAAAVIAGALMVALGVAYVSEWRAPPWLAQWIEGSRVCGLLATVWRSPSLIRSVVIGWVNGFLPCGLSLAVLFQLVSFGSVSSLVAGVYVFGFATLPGLLAVSLLGRGWSATRRRGLVRASGVVLILFGILTVLRGAPVVHEWFHEHLLFQRPASMPMEGEHHH